MQSISRILLPVDFSERSVGAAHYAGSLSCHFGCELVLLHVLVPPQYEFGAADIAGSMLAELCRDRVEQANHDLTTFLASELSGLRVRRIVLEGDPSGCIVDFAHNEPCELIVMPTHGYGPFRRFHSGFEHRQGAARRRLPGMDRRPYGRGAGRLQHSDP